MRGCLGLLVFLAGCFIPDDDDDTPKTWVKYEEGDKAGLFCGYETLDQYADIRGTKPIFQHDRLYESKGFCWDLTVDVDLEEQTARADFGRVAEAGPPEIGCGFHGSGTDRGVTFDGGSCVLPTEMGHVRLTLKEPFEMLLPEFSELTMIFDYQEVRGDDLFTGAGRLFYGRPPGGFGIMSDHEYVDEGPPNGPDVVDPNATCSMPSCSSANFAGKGTLLSGNATVCNELLASYASPFNVYFDAKNRMSFDAAAPEDARFPAVLDKSSCGVRTWGGERPYPLRRYHVDAAGVMTIDEIVLHTSGQLSDVCTLHWETTVTGC